MFAPGMQFWLAASLLVVLGAPLCSAQTCNAGQYWGGNACRVCPDGTYMDLVGHSERACFPCREGSFTRGDQFYDKTMCELCDQGTYQPDRRQAECRVCPDGKYQDELGRATCKICGPGSFTSGDASRKKKCSACRPGTFQPRSGQGSCRTCADGEYQDAWESTTCKTCRAGSFSSGDSFYKDECELCLPGTYQPKEGQSRCLVCEDGTYQDRLGATGCLECRAGTFSKGEAANKKECEPCARGFYQPDAGRGGCGRCPARKYASDPGSTRCDSCPVGSVVDEARSRCSPCERGTYQSAELASSNACYWCMYDSYQQQPGSRECSKCSKGKSTFRRGAVSAADCRPFLADHLITWTEELRQVLNEGQLETVSLGGPTQRSMISGRTLRSCRRMLSGSRMSLCQYFSLWLLPNRYLRFSFLSGDPLTEAECLVAPGASTATCTIYTRRATAQGVSQVLTEEVKLTNVRIQPATGPGPQPTGDKPPGEMPV